MVMNCEGYFVWEFHIVYCFIAQVLLPEDIANFIIYALSTPPRMQVCLCFIATQFMAMTVVLEYLQLPQMQCREHLQ